MLKLKFNKFPSHWTSSAIAAYYAILLNTPDDVMDHMWDTQASHEPKIHKWMYNTSWVGKMLNLSKVTSCKARRQIIDPKYVTEVYPSGFKHQMMFMYLRIRGEMDYDFIEGQAVVLIDDSTDVSFLKVVDFDFNEDKTIAIFHPEHEASDEDFRNVAKYYPSMNKGQNVAPAKDDELWDGEYTESDKNGVM